MQFSVCHLGLILLLTHSGITGRIGIEFRKGSLEDEDEDHPIEEGQTESPKRRPHERINTNTIKPKVHHDPKSKNSTSSCSGSTFPFCCGCSFWGGFSICNFFGSRR